MAKSAPTNPSEKLYDAIGQEFATAESGISRGQMMGMPCLQVRGKMFVGLWQDAMVLS